MVPTLPDDTANMSDLMDMIMDGKFAQIDFNEDDEVSHEINLD